MLWQKEDLQSVLDSASWDLRERFGNILGTRSILITWTSLVDPESFLASSASHRLPSLSGILCLPATSALDRWWDVAFKRGRMAGDSSDEPNIRRQIRTLSFWGPVLHCSKGMVHTFNLHSDSFLPIIFPLTGMSCIFVQCLVRDSRSMKIPGEGNGSPLSCPNEF